MHTTNELASEADRLERLADWARRLQANARNAEIDLTIAYSNAADVLAEVMDDQASGDRIQRALERVELARREYRRARDLSLDYMTSRDMPPYSRESWGRDGS